MNVSETFYHDVMAYMPHCDRDPAEVATALQRGDILTALQILEHSDSLTYQQLTYTDFLETDRREIYCINPCGTPYPVLCRDNGVWKISTKGEVMANCACKNAKAMRIEAIDDNDQDIARAIQSEWGLHWADYQADDPEKLYDFLNKLADCTGTQNDLADCFATDWVLIGDVLRPYEFINVRQLAAYVTDNCTKGGFIYAVGSCQTFRELLEESKRVLEAVRDTLGDSPELAEALGMITSSGAMTRIDRALNDFDCVDTMLIEAS